MLKCGVDVRCFSLFEIKWAYIFLCRNIILNILFFQFNFLCIIVIEMSFYVVSVSFHYASILRPVIFR